MQQPTDLNEALIFVRVVEAGSLTAAAERLTMQKSTVSRKLTAMENRLDVRLIQRSTRRLTLTDIGAEHYERCRQIVQAFEEAELALRRVHEEPSGHLRLVMPIEFGQRFLARVIARFLQRYPQVTIEAELTSRRVDIIEEGIDLAIRVDPGHEPDLVCRKLVSAPVRLLASPAYLDRHPRLRHPSDLAYHNCIRNSSSLAHKTWCLHKNDEKIVINPTGNLILNNITAVREALKAHAGIGTVPNLICQDAINHGELVEVLPGWQLPAGNIYGMYMPRRFMPLALEKLLDHCVDEIATTEASPQVRETA
ncbi:LysR family transcriptional regulator [Kistimonas scapharcae]|uniref:LysR family transcriptional regulator n=1 Tax=Kistimonas scapharcae TaxID=1036133 RepID=A0ABP8V721_9GAMM